VEIVNPRAERARQRIAPAVGRIRRARVKEKIL
jgi:hypothetical protein